MMNFIRMIFYPRGLVLAVSSMLIYSKKSKHFIRYLDLKTRKFICRTEQLGFTWDHDFSFSPNGEELIIAFEESGRTYPVPFEVRYENETKEKFPYLLFLLKNYVAQHEQRVPDDITRYLGLIFFETFKR